MRTLWKKFRYRLERGGIRLLAGVVPLLPRRGCVWFANALGAFVFALDKRGRQVSLANLEAAFGDSLTAVRRKEIARASYQNFARTMIDLFWAPRLNEKNFERHIEIVGKEHCAEIRGISSVGISCHNAGFEWSNLAFGFLNMRGYILTEPFKNATLGETFTRLRSVSGQEIITQDFSMLRMLKRIKRGGSVGLLIDLNVPPTPSATVIETFGMKMCATFLHSVIALRTGAQIAPFHSEPLPDGRTKFHILKPFRVDPAANNQQITQQCWEIFEPIIRAKPELWMWSYKHWRYKPRDAQREYPFYAREHSKFEELLENVTNSISKI